MPDGTGLRPGLPLAVEGLSVARPDGTPLLAVPRLEVAPGTSLGIRGPSGAGKSTLLLALAGLLERASGRVQWGGTEILGLSRDRRTRFRAANLGIIFQDFLLFDELDAASNAGLAAMFRPAAGRAAIRARAAGLLADLGLPAGHRAVASFSGGERQRVAVARALAADAPALLADEPTASLDRAAADRLTGDLVAVTRDAGRTLIAVSHDPHLLERMDRVVTVADGRIAEDAHA
ncbi:ATP-binding cassette domain-containing protein [Poseidonocella sp. HB161398]|uniref:ATP-binding cassette domain-containing protein n=1 Tax=Poseidonocella sp. HB161398 TaxID=2320855 RepID=UPI00110977DB|nr:ATP-binding cassette domain-containing protein [Poseidonocella sp. HB161398]